MFHFIPGINRPAGFFLLRSIKGYVARIACISFQDQIAGYLGMPGLRFRALLSEEEEKGRRKKVDKQGGKDIRYNFDTVSIRGKCSDTVSAST